MKEGKFITDIRKAIKEGRLKEPFNGADVKAAVPGYADRTYTVFLPKH